jgi:serine/threonine protein kinase
MKSELQHADDRQIRSLLSADEDSAEYRLAAAHVETCDQCRERLNELAGSTDIDVSVRELLSDYPWDHLQRTRTLAPELDAEPQRELKLDFLGPPSHPEMLGRLGRYEIERVIGRGGMGVVLKAFDTELNRPVAVKVLAQHLAYSGAAKQRFAREAKAAAAVVHEHVVAIHNVDADRDIPFLVMQYISGKSLQARVDREGPLDPKEILRIGIQTAAGLAAAHEQGVIHRDVKPANILLENGVERVLLTDFGLARTVDDASLTHTGILTGTPHYMSPEQANGDVVDHRTDLFSLGAVLYFMATGHPPFRAERAMGVLNRICHEPHRPVRQINSDIPAELASIIDRLLEKKPSQRFATAGEARDALTQLLARWQQFGLAPPASNVRRRAAIAASVIATAAIIGVALMWNPGGSSRNDDRNETSERTATAVSNASEDFEEFLSREEADRQVVQSLDQRLQSLEARSAAAVFDAPDDFAFDLNIQVLEQRLERLNGETLSIP